MNGVIDPSKVQWDAEPQLNADQIVWDDQLTNGANLPGANLRPAPKSVWETRTAPSPLGVGEEALYDYQGPDEFPLLDKIKAHVAKAFPNSMQTHDQERAKAANAVAMAHVFDISVSKAYAHHDELSAQLGTRMGPQTGPELVMDLAMSPVGLGLGVGSALSAGASIGKIAKGFGSFMALQEGVRFGVSQIKDEGYEPFQSEGLSGLLSDDASRYARDYVDLLEFITLGVAGGFAGQGISKMTSGTKGLAELLTHKIVKEYKLPDKVYIPAEKIRDIVSGRNKITTPEEYDLVTALGLSGPEYRKALKQGLDIAIPAQRIVTVMDRPYWSTLKGWLGLRPYVKSGKDFGLAGPDIAPKGEIGYTPGEKPALDLADVPTPGGNRFKYLDITGKSNIDRIAKIAERLPVLSADRLFDPATVTSEEALNLGRVYYDELSAQPVTPPAFHGAEVRFDDVGWDHFFTEDTGKKRSTAKTTELLSLLPRAKAVLENAPFVDDVRVFQDGKDTLIKSIGDTLQFPQEGTLRYGLTGRFADGQALQVVIEERRIGDKSYLSVFEIKDVSRRLKRLPAESTSSGQRSSMDAAAPNDRVSLAFNDLIGHSGEKVNPIDELANEPAPGKPPKESEVPRFLEAVGKNDINKVRLREILADADRIPDRTRLARVEDQEPVFSQDDEAARRMAKGLVRDAYAAGKDAGEAKGLARLEAHTTHDDIRAQQRRLREHVESLVDRIRRLPTDNTDFAYKQTIEALQGLLPENWKDATRTDAIRQFIEENPDAVRLLTPAMAERLKSAPLAQQTLGDLQALHDTVMALSAKGKQVRSEKLAERDRRHSDVREGIVKALGGYAYKPGKTTRASSKHKNIFVAGKDGAIGIMDAESLRPQRIFDMLDGGNASFSGPAHRFFIDRTNELIDARSRFADSRRDAYLAIEAAHGIGPKELIRSHVVDGESFTLDEMLDIYAKWQNPRGKLAAIATLADRIKAEGVTLEEAFARAEARGEAVIAKLTSKEKAFADSVIDEYDRNFERLRRAYIDYANEDLAAEGRYTPIKRIDAATGENSFEIADELLQRAGLQKAYAPKGMTISRRDIPPEFQKPIRLGLVETWQRQVDQQEHFIHLAQHVREMQRIIGDNRVSDTVRARIGDPYMEAVKSYVNRVANPAIFRAQDGLAGLSQHLRRNAYTAYLAFSIKSVANQIAGLPLYVRSAGPVHLSAACWEFSKNPAEMIRFVCDRDTFIKHRAILREFEELQAVGATDWQQAMEPINALGKKLTTVVDRLITVVGWKATYDRAIAQGLSEVEAIRLARNATLLTQSVADPHLLPGIMTKNEALNWLSFMQNQGNQLWNILRYDIPHEVKGGDYLGALMSGVGLLTSAAIIYIIDEHTLDIGKAAAKQTVENIPLVGSYIFSASQGWHRYPVPLDIALSASDAVRDVAFGDINGKTMDELWKVAALSWGLPYTQPKRVLKALDTGDPAELVGKKK